MPPAREVYLCDDEKEAIEQTRREHCVAIYRARPEESVDTGWAPVFPDETEPPIDG